MPPQDLIHICIAVVSTWVACVSGQACRAQYTLHQMCPWDYGQLLQTFSPLSLVACGSACEWDAFCRSFVYNPATRVCKTYVDLMFSPPACNAADKLTFGELHRASCHDTWIWDQCQSDLDCAKPNSGCYTSQCQCHPGFSYRSKSDSCVGDCPAPGYGPTWTEEDYVLEWNSFAPATGGSNIEHCQDLCKQYTGFVCRRIELLRDETHQCHLFNETLYTQPDARRTSTPDLRYSFIRNCY